MRVVGQTRKCKIKKKKRIKENEEKYIPEKRDPIAEERNWCMSGDERNKKSDKKEI